ncbi:MAG: S8 family peptidase [Candidatus Bathycorpusculaceae bacterium]
MRKIVVMAIMLVLLAVIVAPLPVNGEATPSTVSLAFDVLPARDEFIDMVNLELPAGEVEDPMPFWVDAVDAEYFEDGGEGIYVAVLDTGLLEYWPFFFTNPATGECRIKAEWGKGFTHDIWWDDTIGDFVIGPLRDDRGFITDSFKGSGHGTHVVSTIIGYRFRTAYADMWIRGVAPKATIIPVLVLDAWEVLYPGGSARFTGGTDEMVSAGILYVAWLAETYGVKIIINMSLGGSEPSPMIEDAINYAISKGVVVVAAAGNEGEEGMDWPGAYPQVISAAAGGWTEQWITKPPETRWWLNDVPEKLNTEDYWGNKWQVYLEEFSARPNKTLGQKWFYLDITAPGASIVGPFKNYFSYIIGYYYLWGTSMATPHVSGIASIILQKYPCLTQSFIEAILKLSAQCLPPWYDGAWVYDPFVGDIYYFEWNCTDWGAGWVQADRAICMVSFIARLMKTHLTSMSD